MLGPTLISSKSPESSSLAVVGRAGVAEASNRPCLSWAVCDSTQNADTDLFLVPNIFHTNTGTFLVQYFSNTDSETFFLYQILPILVLRLFPVPIFSDTGSDTIRKMKNSQSRTHYKSSKFLKKIATKISSGTKFFHHLFRDFFLYQVFPLLI